MNEDLNEALDQISDEHINEAAQRRSRKKYFFASVAALLAVVIGWTAVWHDWNQSEGPVVPIIQATDPTTIPRFTVPADPSTPSESTKPVAPTPPVVVPLSGLVAEPVYPEMVKHPELNGGQSWKDYNASQKAQYDQPEGYADGLETFFQESIRSFLSGDGNKTCSPLNVYMTLAMLAEVSDGDTRQQILDLMDCNNIEALRTQAGHIWNAHYQADGTTASVLANSLWLDNGYDFDQSTADTLADSYYASVFTGDLGTEEMDQLLRDWLNEQTSGLLKDAVQDVSLDPHTVFTLASTVYYRVKWDGRFNEDLNTVEPFHSPSGDTDVTYMHRTLKEHTYYSGDGYGAVALELADQGRMWLILPDESITPRQLLDQGGGLGMVLGGQRQGKKADVLLTLPKFDIASDMELTEQIKSLGVTDAFSSVTADFSPLVSDAEGLCVDKVSHAARVKIDEEGLSAAAYTILQAPTGMPRPPEELEQIEFTVDRPFLFAITSSDGLPLFAGVVEQP